MLVDGSTTHTAGCSIHPRQRRCRYVDHRPGTGFDASVHGRAELHGCRGIRQADLDFERSRDRIGLCRDLANTPSRRHLRIVCQADGDLQIGRRGSDQLSGNIEHRVTAVLPRNPCNHLPGLNDLAGRRTCRGDLARRVGSEFGEADEVVGGAQLGLRRVDLRLGGLLRLRRHLEIGARGPPLCQQRLLTFVVIARLRQLALRGGKGRLCLPQRVQLVLRLQSRQQLSGLNPIADLGVIRQQAS